MVKLITKNLWSEITRAVMQTKTKSFIAVAYFGQNGSKMLPLNKGSVLVVDASEKALKTGQTCPDELLKLYYKGVHIYSQESLHAKLYVIGNNLYCGSANVSGNSANRLKEVLIKTDDKIAIEDAKEFINAFCRIELGDDELKLMAKIYVAPKNLGENKKMVENEYANFYIVYLRLADWTEKDEEEANKGRERANRNRINKSRHRVDEFKWGSKLSFKIGDTILQITEEKDRKFVTPVGKLIHIRKWSNGKATKHICYVEVPERKRKNLEVVKKQLDILDTKAIMRAGKKKMELENRIKKIWA